MIFDVRMDLLTCLQGKVCDRRLFNGNPCKHYTVVRSFVLDQIDVAASSQQCLRGDSIVGIGVLDSIDIFDT